MVRCSRSQAWRKTMESAYVMCLHCSHSCTDQLTQRNLWSTTCNCLWITKLSETHPAWYVKGVPALTCWSYNWTQKAQCHGWGAPMQTWGNFHWLVQGCCLEKTSLCCDREHDQSTIFPTAAYQWVRLIINGVVPCLHGKRAFCFCLSLMLRLLAFLSGLIILIVNLYYCNKVDQTWLLDYCWFIHYPENPCCVTLRHFTLMWPFSVWYIYLYVHRHMCTRWQRKKPIENVWEVQLSGCVWKERSAKTPSAIWLRSSCTSVLKSCSSV